MRAYFAFALFVALAMPLARAQADAPTRDEAITLLSAYEGGPSADQWRAFGPETLDVLIELYNDRNQPGFVRLRAVGAAAHYALPATRTFLLSVAREARQGDLFVRQAVAGLGRAFGAQAFDDVRPFLTHREHIVRETAAHALGQMNLARARELLEAQLRVEQDQVVRVALTRALRR